MGAKSFQELVAWQLGDELRNEISVLVKEPELRTAFALRDQLDRAADSVCANIAEGFRRHTHRQFAHFLDIASGSLGEIEDRLNGVVGKRRVNRDRVEHALLLTKRTSVAVARLRNYLLSTPTPKPPKPSDEQ
ncbi:MAG: four helix bundle protein [Vicinamibacterales bacterium]